MAPFTLGVITVVQGLYSLIWILILIDVGSPVFDLSRVTGLSGVSIALSAVALVIVAPVVGMAMHTASRNFFRLKKDAWAFEIFTSAPVTKRLAAIGGSHVPDRSTVRDILELNAEGIRKCGEILHGIHYKVALRHPGIHAITHVYRMQYRLARGFVVPSLLLALTLPFWDVTGDLPAVERFGPFSLVGLQLSLLATLFSAVSYMAFRERAYRYTAALMMGYITIESEPTATVPSKTT